MLSTQGRTSPECGKEKEKKQKMIFNRDEK